MPRMMTRAARGRMLRSRYRRASSRLRSAARQVIRKYVRPMRRAGGVFRYVSRRPYRR